MTIQEAIKELTHELSVWESDCKSIHPMKEALRVAIEGLENLERLEEDNSRLAHNNFKLKKEIADWRAKAVQKWVNSREEKTCSDCIHYDKEEWELPCVRCSRGNKDYWKGRDTE